MKNFKQMVVVVFVLGIVMILAGCNETYAQKKQAMEAHWEKSTAQAKLPMAEDLINRGEIDQAKETLNKCLAAAPEMPRVHLLVGRVHFIEGRTDEARQSFLKSVELDSQLDQGWYSLGTLAILEKDYNLAMEYLQRALQLQPANSDYLVSICELYIEMGQLDQSHDVIQNGLSKQPNNLELLLTMARLHQQSGQMVKAVQVYEQALLIHGQKPQILEPCAYGYMELEQWAKAADKFESLLKQYHQDQEHYNITLRSLAMCSFNAENYGRALTCYDKLSVVYREDPEVWVGMAQSALGLDDTQRSIHCAQKALQYHPSWPRAYAVLGSALYMKGQYEQSLDAFNQIIGDDEFAAFAWFMTGRCYRQLGQTIQANSAFDRAEQLDPNNELVTMFLKRTLKSL